MKKLVLLVLLIFFIGSLDASILDFFKKKDKNKKEEKKAEVKKKADKEKDKKDKEVKKEAKDKKSKIDEQKKQVKERAKKDLKKKKEDVKKANKNPAKTPDKKANPVTDKSRIEKDLKNLGDKLKPNDKTKQIKKPGKKNLEKEKKSFDKLKKDVRKPSDKKKVDLKANKPDKKTLKPNPDKKADNKLNLDTKKKPDKKNLKPNKKMNLDNKKPENKNLDNKKLDNKNLKDSPKVGPRKDEKYGDSRNTPSATPIKPSIPVLPSSNLVPNKSLGNIVNNIPKSKPSVNKPKLMSNNWGFDILLGAGQMINSEVRKQNDLYGINMPFDYSINAGIAPYQILMGDNIRLRSLIHWEGQNVGDYSLGQVMIGTGPQYILPRVLKIPVESSIGTRAGISIGYSVVWNGGKKDIEFLKASFSPFVEPYVMLKSRLMKGFSVGTEFSYMKPVSSKEFSIESNGHKYNLKTGDLGGVRARFVISLNPGF